MNNQNNVIDITETRQRVDVIPVTLWDPPESLVDVEPAVGSRLWVAGSVQRRFWSGADGRRSRLEVVADQVCLRGETAGGGSEGSCSATCGWD